MERHATVVNFEQFVDKQLSLIDLEHEAEKEESRTYQEKLPLPELLRRGVLVHKLCVSGSKTGLYGRTVITFEPNPITHGKDGVFPAHNITSGDIVEVGCGPFEPSNFLCSGVVLSSRKSDITVAFEEDADSADIVGNDSNNFFLIKIANDVTYRRLKTALTHLRQNKITDRASQLREVLFGERQVSEPSNTTKDIVFFNTNLDDSQREAVKFALNQREVAIIHGPPGTGKTTTVIEFILQAIKSGLKILATAPSNIAVDNLLERLADAKVPNLVRLGHPARASAHLQKFSLDAAIMRSDQRQLVNDIRVEIDAARKDRTLRNTVKGLRKELRVREARALAEVLKGANVVLGTLTSSSTDGPLKAILAHGDPSDQFDVVVIDECSQALEASCWIPLVFAPKCVLAGDHLQLPPTILSEKAAKMGLRLTLMERLIKNTTNEAGILRMLTVQYRMHQDIMHWSSKNLYEDKLVAHETVKNHVLSDIYPEADQLPLVMIDTAGCDYLELEVEDEESKGNEHEADLVAIYVEELISCGVDPKDIGVITPYNLQVDLIRRRLKTKYEKIEVKSVDGFQGREKEVIVISLVRSNSKREVGFLSEFRRINVAVTRARRHLVIVGDSDTISSDKHIATLIEHIEEVGDFRSAHEFDGQLTNYNHVERPAGLRFKEVKQEVDKKSKKGDFVKKERDPLIEEQRKEKMRLEIVDFIKSSSTRLDFPETLNSFERKLVHDFAEQFGLNHESVGEGKERRITISKLEVIKEELEHEQGAVGGCDVDCDQDNQIDGEDEDIDKLVENLSEKFDIESKPQSSNSVSKKKKKSSKKPSNGEVVKKVEEKKVLEVPKPAKNLIRKDKLQAMLDNADEDDFDSLIEAAIKSDKSCAFVKCKTSTTIFGMQCTHCARKFCYNHSQSEVHGCGHDAKVAAKKMVSKEGRIYPGSGPVNHKGDPVKRVHLARRLNKKLDEMESKRMNKKEPEK